MVISFGMVDSVIRFGALVGWLGHAQGVGPDYDHGTTHVQVGGISIQ